jgi:hypothetical protein
LLKQGQPLDKQALVAEGGFYFEVDGPSGRVQLRTDQWDYLITGKERAAMLEEWLLAAIPLEGAKAHRYLFVSRQGGVPKVFYEQPDAGTDPVAARLWVALQRRFPGELAQSIQ